MLPILLEAMAAGKPVIATKVGGNPELVIDGHNGILIAKENVEELTNALQSLLGNETKRKELGQNSLHLVQKSFSMEAMVEHYEKLFDHLAAPKRKRGI